MESQVAGSEDSLSGNVSLNGNVSTSSQALPQAASSEIIAVKCGSATGDFYQSGLPRRSLLTNSILALIKAYRLRDDVSGLRNSCY